MSSSKDSVRNTPEGQSWQSYWAGAGDAAALNMEGAVMEQLRHEWERFFDDYLGKVRSNRLLDMASGNGVLTGIAYEYAMQHSLKTEAIHSLDISEFAIESIRKKYPEVKAIAADAAQTGFSTGFFDLIVSQYGIEYAGVDAIAEVGRLLSPLGQLMFICHLKFGQIYKQCEQDLSIIESFLESGLLETSQAAFDCGFSVFSGNAAQGDFQPLNSAMMDAGARAKPILNQPVQTPLINTLRAIFVDIGEMYKRLTQYNSADVMDWFEKTTSEVEAYKLRMRAMLDSSMDETEINQYLALMESASLKVTCAEKLVSASDGEPFAWVIKAHRA